MTVFFFFCGIQLVFFVHNADIHADIARLFIYLRQLLACVACVFHCVVNTLKEQPFLRLHYFRFFWCYIEEERVKLIHTVNKSAPLAVDGSIIVFVFIKVRFVFPSVLGNFCDAIKS